MYYILLLSQMSKLQFCSESNYAAIFRLNSLPGKILFWASDWEFFSGNWEKRRIFWIGKWTYIRPLVIGRKGPVVWYFPLYSNLNITLFKQTVETLTRRHILRRLVWVHTVCVCPTKRTLVLYGLMGEKCNLSKSFAKISH